MAMKKLLFLIPLLIGCSSQKEKSRYEELAGYEGKYEYIGDASLTLVASEMDTTLYAVIDDAKYPLNYVGVDSFTNAQDSPVIFQRDENGKIRSYQVDGETFAYIGPGTEKLEMYPRKELFHNAEAYAYKSPEKTKDGLAVGDLKLVFADPQPILDMVKETIKGAYPDVHSILIYKDGKLVLEEYFYGYEKDAPHQLRSATKPFIGALVGIAIAQGKIGSEQDKLLPYFGKQYGTIANLNLTKKEITIENFLTYRHGMDCENNNPKSKGNELRMMESEDWVKHTLDLPMVQRPGKQASYCSGCALTLGRLVEIATGEKLESFARENLFGPMGITNYKWKFAPNQSSMTTFSQMYLTPRDLIKLAKMYADGGKWQGKQVLPESWTKKTFDMEEGDYGYLWEHKYFVMDGKRYNSYLASGNGGQKINIWPELNMITVFTGGSYNAYALYGKSTPPNEMIPKYILKALE
jgi:CubicO group peptidase (beta-lactamase class C family)